MSFFDYLYACGFWQWFGNIILAAIIFENLASVVKSICSRRTP